MLVLELSGVEIDYCPASGGIWLDAGELETLLGNADAAGELLGTFVAARGIREKRVRCPRCNKKMEKVMAGGRVLIDRCVKGHGLWFDKGELLQVLEMEQSGGVEKVTALLRDMFREQLGK
jgi:Zn-finger nucleic acid-binding protein